MSAAVPLVSLGPQIVAWIEHHLVHGPGDVQGEPIELDDELAVFLVRCYTLDPETGRRLYDEALLSRPKGRAKSELAGMVTCAEALGPVRFSHWAEPGEVAEWGYEYEPGEPVGRPVTYPFIRCLATEQDQSGNTYGNVAFMLQQAAEDHPEVFGGVDIGQDWQTSTRVYLPGGGEIVPSTASDASKDGGKETFSVFDETHLYVLDALRSMYRTVKRNTAKRRQAQPWVLQTSTMYAPGEESIAEATHRRHRKGAAPRLLLDHKGARRHVEDLTDRAALLPELQHAYGPFAKVMDLDRILDALRDEEEDEAERRRYWLNEEFAGSSRWIAPAAWEACAQPGRTIADGEPVGLGLDGSITQDTTALVACDRTGHLQTVGMWERPRGPRGDGWTVPDHEVDAAVAAAFTRWQVARLYGDPAWWQGWLATWAERYGANRVAQWWTNREGPWSRALRSFRTAVMSTPPKVSHDGDRVLARHIANAHTRATRGRDEEGRQLHVIQKDRPGSPRKIDGAVAATLAYLARTDALAAGEMEKEQGAWFGIAAV